MKIFKIFMLAGFSVWGITCSHPRKCHQRNFFVNIKDSTHYNTILDAQKRRELRNFGISECAEVIDSQYFYKFSIDCPLFYDTTLYICKENSKFFLISKKEYNVTHILKKYLFIDFSKKRGEEWYALYNPYREPKYDLAIKFDSIWHSPDFTKLRSITLNVDSLSTIDKKDWKYSGNLYCFTLFSFNQTSGTIFVSENGIEYLILETHGTCTVFIKCHPTFKFWEPKDIVIV